MPKTPKKINREQLVTKVAEKLGLRVYRTGWPDLLIYDPDEEKTVCVEVKSGQDNLTGKQLAMQAALQRAGMKVYTLFVGEANCADERNRVDLALRYYFKMFIE